MQLTPPHSKAKVYSLRVMIILEPKRVYKTFSEQKFELDTKEKVHKKPMPCHTPTFYPEIPKNMMLEIC